MLCKGALIYVISICKDEISNLSKTWTYTLSLAHRDDLIDDTPANLVQMMFYNTHTLSYTTPFWFEQKNPLIQNGSKGNFFG